MNNLVLDTWAVLALLQREEPAASHVRQLLQDAQQEKLTLFMSVINLGEVFYRVGKVSGADVAQETISEIHNLSLTVLPATNERVFAAAGLKMHYSISYADAFAAATAIELNASLATGDPELTNLPNLKICLLTRIED